MLEKGDIGRGRGVTLSICSREEGVLEKGTEEAGVLFRKL